MWCIQHGVVSYWAPAYAVSNVVGLELAQVPSDIWWVYYSLLMLAGDSSVNKLGACCTLA